MNFLASTKTETLLVGSPHGLNITPMTSNEYITLWLIVHPPILLTLLTSFFQMIHCLCDYYS